jgi:hypothetical protein
MDPDGAGQCGQTGGPRPHETRPAELYGTLLPLVTSIIFSTPKNLKTIMILTLSTSLRTNAKHDTGFKTAL